METLQTTVFSLFSHFVVFYSQKKEKKKEKFELVNRCGTPWVGSNQQHPPARLIERD